MFDSIIFDLDGTLWDAVDNILISWNEVLSGHSNISKKITKDELTACMGLGMYEIASRLFPFASTREQKELMDECSRYEIEYLAEHGANIFDGIEETVTELSKGYRLFICSNCQCGYIECFLKVSGLEKFFTDFECWGRTGLTKGENNKLLIKRNSLASPVYVGDTTGDERSARDAGIPFVFASYGFGSSVSPDHIINKPTELLSCLNRL